jgi:two-component system, NtrC family, response regulator AlgB
MGSILIIDGDKSVSGDLTAYLRGRGHQVEALSDATEVPTALARHDFDVILADGELASTPGSAFLSDVLRHYPAAVVALTTAHPTVAEAVEVMRAGAYDYLAKPVSPRQVEVLIRRAGNLGNTADHHSGSGSPDAHPLWESANPQMVAAITTARQAAASDIPVLITGESGTGKQTLAAAIHSWSPRRAAPFLTVWCAALGEHRLGSGLLEHLQGACTGIRKTVPWRGETVGSGTLFFDEVGNGNLPASFQVKLVGQLEAARFGPLFGTARKEVAARIIAASHCDLAADVRNGRLREDLFFYLNVVTIAVPPLRERMEDLPMLRDHLVARFAARHGRSDLRLTRDAEAVLARYHWPGNLRELMSVLERAVVLSHQDRIGADDLSASLSGPALRNGGASVAQSLSLVESEQHQIALALNESSTLGEAAARLGIDPATLWRKRKRYGLDRPRSNDRARASKSS